MLHRLCPKRKDVHIISALCILLTEHVKLQKKKTTVLGCEVCVFGGLVQVKGYRS